jgi:hypothetical protein
MRAGREIPVDAPVMPPRGVSLLRYSPALVFLAIVLVDLSRWADPDLWGHLRFGQAVIAQRHLTWFDPYSYSVPGHPWRDYEWLGEVLMAALYNAFGMVGLKLMKFACSALIVVLLAIAMEDTEAPPMLQAAIVLVSAIPIATHVQFRPQLVTFVMVSGLLAILARYNYRGRARLWLVLPMFALWANFHGGWIIGLGILGVFGAAVLAEDLAEGRGMSRGTSLLGLTAAAAVATLANPYGIGAWQAVLHTLGNPRTHTAIVEWLPFPDSIAYHYRAHHYGSIICKSLAVALFAAFALAVWRAPRGRDFPLVCVAVMTIAAAFVAVRNLPIALIATAIPLARHGAIALNSELRPQRERQATIYQLMIALTAGELLLLSGLFSPKLNADDPYPVGAVAFMKQHGLTGNILAQWPFGAYVIWHMAPTSRVFIDGRYDTVYPMRVIDDYLAFEHGEQAGTATLNRYPHDFVLMQPEKVDAFKLLSLQAGWKELYRDASCVLFVHDGRVAAGLTPITVSPHDTPQNTFP